VTEPARFCLLRHAQTEWNRDRRIQGQTESRLTAEGEEAARRWGRGLAHGHWDLLLASDLGRARRTAELVREAMGRPDLAMETDPRLRELDWGRWAGASVAELRRDHGDEVARQEAAGWDFRPPGGESRREMLARALAALADAAGRHPGSTVLCVTHTGVLKSLVNHLRGWDFLPGRDDEVRRGRLRVVDCRPGDPPRLELVAVGLRPGEAAP
jgi:probable phosphoglycerate mutase